MSTALVQISRESLWQKMERGDEFVLVDALAPLSYAAAHLPGAISIPPDDVTERAKRRIPDRGAEIVVYCADATCESSVVVANRLIELGYRNVLHYVEGKTGWIEAGLPLEGGRVRQSALQSQPPAPPRALVPPPAGEGRRQPQPPQP
jgi:rhodanese-related sulfurtransferase